MCGARLVTPVLLYREPELAAQWLKQAFGAERDAIYHAPSGDIDCITLRLGQSRVLICSRSNGSLDGHSPRGEQRGVASTQMCYLAVDDVQEHFRRARVQGAGIVNEPQDDGNGGRFYVCCDCEGHLWSIGTQMYGARPGARQRRPSRVLTGLSLLLGLAALGMAGGWLTYQADPEGAQKAAFAIVTTWQSTARAQAQSAKPEAAATEALERKGREFAEQLERERTTHREQLRSLQDELAKAVRAREDLERAVADMRAKVAATEQTAKDKAAVLVREQAGAQDRLGTLQSDLAKAEAAREALARTTADIGSKLAAAEQAAKDGVVILALERARTEVVEDKLRILQAKVEQLEGALAVERTLRASSAANAVMPVLTRCALATQGKVKIHQTGSRHWDAASLKTLCKGAEASTEPARCYDRLMSGQVSWGGGTAWETVNALALCGGSHGASQTIECFNNAIAFGHGWRTATHSCRR